MFHKHNNYNNFIRSSPSATSHGHTDSNNTNCTSLLNGEQAKKLYLEEICDVQNTTPLPKSQHSGTEITKTQTNVDLSDQELFLAVQNNDVNTLKQALNLCPDKINIVDQFGWSLLMIACQANSVETAGELLKHNIDTNVRDKAGNSATGLVINNKNLKLADILLKHKRKRKSAETTKPSKIKLMKINEYQCESCMNVYADKHEHLSSTVHNINASKGRKIPTNYGIPESNKGYQIMVKVGWDKETGLGPDGTGQKYPIKAIQKKDRKGLGHDNRKLQQPKKVDVKHKSKKILNKEYHNNRRMEIDFRREFY